MIEDPKTNIRSLNDIKKVLDGDFVNIQVGYDINEYEVPRKIGDIWEDSNGKKWEQMNGYRTNITKFDDIRDDIRKYRSCPMEVCKVTQYNETRLDAKFKNLMGMCSKCVAKLETKIRAEGKWDEYEKNKLKQNAISHLKDKQSELQDMMNSLDEFHTIRENGKIDRWKGIDPEKVKIDLQESFERFKAKVKTQYSITDEELM